MGGAVAGVEGAEPVFVARRMEGGRIEAAYLEMGKERGFGRIAVYNEGKEEDIVTECDLLVEVEPVRYELDLQPFVKKVKREKIPTVLATTSIFRFEEGTAILARMQKMMFYQNEMSLYFGQVKGTIRGLPGMVKMPYGETKVIIWGMMDKDKQRESIMVGYDMKKNSAIDVKVVADSLLDEQHYNGLLRAIFPDGSGRDRQVEGVMQSRYLDRIRPEYSKLYKIQEQSPGLHLNINNLPVSREETDLTYLSKKLQQARELEPVSGGEVLVPGLVWGVLCLQSSTQTMQNIKT